MIGPSPAMIYHNEATKHASLSQEPIMDITLSHRTRVLLVLSYICSIYAKLWSRNNDFRLIWHNGHHYQQCQGHPLSGCCCFVFCDVSTSFKNRNKLSDPKRHFFLGKQSQSFMVKQRKRKAGSNNSNPRSETNLDDVSISKNDDDIAHDTIRVRIWRALVSANGEEISLQQLGSLVGERKFSDLRSHLTHVERQANTFANKSAEWKERRGLVKDAGNGTAKGVSKVKIKSRNGNRNKIFIRLQMS
jgi:hypothetical protein